jgi:perosamine synthetase
MRLNLPWTDQSELDQIAEVLKTGFFTQGPKVKQFEEKISGLIGSKYAFAASSCTTALHLALVSMGIKPGDEILVADFTFPATANIVVQLGAVPILVDIEMNTFTMDIQDLHKKLNSKSKAIIPVSTFGCTADMDPILEAARQYNIPVLEDAACSLGATYKERFSGNIASASCFSFHPRKSISTGEGGMITTNDETLAKRIALLRNHGGTRIGYWFEFEEAGFNYRLSDIQGAMGLAQFEKLPTILERKSILAHELTERLSGIPGFRPPLDPTWGKHTYQSYVILVDEGINRNQIIEDLRANDIECTLGTYALHDQPFFQREYGYHNGELVNSDAAFHRSITLPLYPQMTEADLEILTKTVKNVFSKVRR